VVLARGTELAEPVVVNESGALVWDLLDRPRSLDELVQELELVVHGNASVIRDDVDRLLDQLADCGVVVDER
jgi:hypothetical protein